MKKKVLSLMMLATLAACGGGGGGGSTPAPVADDAGKTGNTGNPATPDTAGAGQNAMTQKADVIARFNSCPTVIASRSPDAATCLAGTYEGTDLFTKERCTVKIAANGATEASRAALTLQQAGPNTFSSFNKITYSPISGTSPIGYIINWAAAGDGANEAGSAINFQFNVQYDEKLTIEVKQGRPNNTATISCGISL